MTEQATAQGPFDGLFTLGTDNTSLRAAMGAHADGFWRAQNEMLASLETLAQAWFQRRRLAATCALETAQTVCGATNPLDAALAVQRWFAGSAERIAADGMDAQAHFLKLSQAWFDGLRGAASAFDEQKTRKAADTHEAGRSELRAA